jgi:two-component system sensor histidine kinase DesK
MPTANSTAKQNRRNWAWTSLVYSSFLFIQPFMASSLTLWIATITVFGLFFAVFFGYIRAVSLGRPLRFWMVAATFALGLLTFPWNPGGATFFVYAAVFLPYSIESIRRILWLFLLECSLILVEGCILFFSATNSWFHLRWPILLIAFFLFVVIAGSNFILTEQKRADDKLLAAQEENIALASVAERERIARDLHDVLGHTLSVILMKAELAGRLVPLDPARATAEISEVEQTARFALKEIREAIAGYRARGLAAEIEAARRTLDMVGVAMVTEGDPFHAASLSLQEETALALALREAVTNIVRHASAKTCRLRFIAEAGQRRMMIEDDGPNCVTREGNGLRGMRERIESLRGHLLLQNAIENQRGTRLVLELPLHENVSS